MGYKFSTSVFREKRNGNDRQQIKKVLLTFHLDKKTPKDFDFSLLSPLFCTLRYVIRNVIRDL